MARAWQPGGACGDSEIDFVCSAQKSDAVQIGRGTTPHAGLRRASIKHPCRAANGAVIDVRAGSFSFSAKCHVRRQHPRPGQRARQVRVSCGMIENSTRLPGEPDGIRVCGILFVRLPRS